MALINCPECKKEISDQSVNCPNCGYPMKSWHDESSKTESKKNFKDIWNKLDVYERIIVVAIIVFAIMTIIAFVFGKTASAIFSIISIVLIVVSYLLKKEIIKAPKSWLNIVALALAFVLIIPYVGNYKQNYGRAEKFEWSAIVLNEIIPEPDSLFGEINSNSSECFSVDLYKVDKNDFSNYVEDCLEKGFTIDAEQLSDTFCAFNDEGYKISVTYSVENKCISIVLETPESYDTFEWPTTGLATVLPMPKSNVGKIEQYDEKCCSIYISQMTFDDYKAYVSECSKIGFNVETLNDKKFYSAKNADGYKISVEYEGNNVIHIKIDAPEYKVSVEVECVENLIFSTYDIEVYLNNELKGTVVHGGTKTFDLILAKGIYTLKFVSEDEKLENEIILHIYQNENLRFKLSCYSTEIDVDTIVGTLPAKDGSAIGYTPDYNDAESFEKALNDGKKVNGSIVKFVVNDYKPDSALGINVWAGEHLNFISQKEKNVSAGDTVIAYVTGEPSKVFASWEIPCEVLVIDKGKNNETTQPQSNETETNKNAVETSEVESQNSVKDEPEKTRPVFYSTNDYETAKKGNTGVFSYKNKSGSYDIYWIIDFDTGYVYYFTDGNGETFCDKVKIVSGDLNDKITVTWHDGGDQWSWYLHFKYKNHPETLVINDHNGFPIEFTTTDLDDALKIRNTKTIKEY